MTELDSLRPLYTQDFWEWDTNAPDFPIKEDTQGLTVTVAAGVQIRQLLDFLAFNRKGKCSTNGCLFHKFPQLIEQTVGGAVATSTHGSSGFYTTVASQVVGIEVVTGNGTLLHVTKESNSHLFSALQVNVGRLGVVTKLTLDIIPQPTIKRTRREITAVAAIQKLRQWSATHAAAAGDPAKLRLFRESIKDALILWFQPIDTLWLLEFEEVAAPDSDDAAIAGGWAIEGLLRHLHAKAVSDDPALPTFGDQLPVAPLGPQRLLEGNAKLITRAFMLLINSGLNNLTGPGLISYAITRPEWLGIWANLGPMNEYEVCVPINKAADAMQQIYDVFESTPALKEDMRTPTGFRFVAEEAAYLAYGSGGDRICIEVDDFTSLTNGKPNVGVQTMVSILHDHDGRLHWSKAGWEEYEPCFSGADKYGEAWCHFGCAVQELDPTGKFNSAGDAWSWFATTTQGDAVDFASACAASGFNTESFICARRPASTCKTSSGVGGIHGKAERTHIEL